MRARVAVVALLVLGLAGPGCTSGGRRNAPSTTASSASAANGAALLPATSTVFAVPALASYSRSGGPAGLRFEVVVRPDGTFEGGSGKRAQGHLGAAGLDELRSLVAAFAAVAPEPSYGQPGPTGVLTSVTAGGRSTTIQSGADPPPPVQRLVTFLAALERQLPR